MFAFKPPDIFSFRILICLEHHVFSHYDQNPTDKIYSLILFYNNNNGIIIIIMGFAVAFPWRWLFMHWFQIELEFRSADFCGGRKTGEPGEKPSEGQEPTTNSTHMWRRVWESNPGHSGGRRVLSPLRHPCSPGMAILLMLVPEPLTRKGIVKLILVQSPVTILGILTTLYYAPINVMPEGEGGGHRIEWGLWSETKICSQTS